uniref:N-acetyltransferase domain-containing protein n=1 Tax=Bursaphelenchus xylophilus TaxID=6326 RepID=A0A1I7RXD0_BURXY
MFYLPQVVGVDPQVFYDQLLLPIIETCLHFPYTTLAFDGDELVGYHLMNMDRFDEKTYASPRDVDDLEFLKEKACTAYNVTDENLKFMATVLYYAIHMTPHYLPKREGGQVVAHGEMVCVRKDYKGNALLGALLQQGCVAVHEHGFVEYYMGNSTSLATNHSCVELGAEKLWEFMYKDVKFNGVHVFNKGTIASDEFIALNLGRVEDIVKNDFIQRHTAGLA